MTTDATAPAVQTAARRYSESMHVLVERPTRAVLLGLAQIDANEGGYTRLREGDTVRGLLDQAIEHLYNTDPKRYRDAVRRGTKLLDDRDSHKI